jgi:hypothetical protein
MVLIDTLVHPFAFIKRTWVSVIKYNLVMSSTRMTIEFSLASFQILFLFFIYLQRKRKVVIKKKKDREKYIELY